MKSIMHIIIFVFALSLTVPACKKDSPASYQSMKELLTAHPWKPFSVTTNDVVADPVECSKDDLYIFKADGSYTLDIGSVPCFAGNHTETFKWTFSPNEKYVTLNAGWDYMIVELSESKLVLLHSNYIIITELVFIPS